MHLRQEAVGSVAELFNGCAGPAGASVGAVECQEGISSFHFHWFFSCNVCMNPSMLNEIAEVLDCGFLASSKLKDFFTNLCVTLYANLRRTRVNWTK